MAASPHVSAFAASRPLHSPGFSSIRSPTRPSLLRPLSCSLFATKTPSSRPSGGSVSSAFGTANSNDTTSPSTPQDQDESHVFDAVIIGAGWAGLGAAHTLEDNGVTNLCVLEARDRIGGRCVTSHELGVDLGASWIQGNDPRHNPIQRLVEQYGLPYAKSDVNSAVAFGSDGHELTSKEMYKMTKRTQEFQKYMRKRQRNDKMDASLEDVLQGYLTSKGIARGSEEEASLRWMLDGEIVQEYAASLSELSLKFWDIDEWCPGGDSYLAVGGGGYSEVVQKYASGIKAPIRLCTKVTSIAYPKEDDISICSVNTDNGQIHETIKTEHAIVTLPLGVLKAKSVAFTPELPKAKLRAIDSLGLGLMNKVVLCWNDMKDPFWSQEKEWIQQQTFTNGPRGVSEFYNPGRFDTDSRILIGFIIGETAKAMEGYSDSEVVQDALRNLKKIFGTDVPKPSLTKVTRWGEDEFSLGSYSFQKLGSNKNSRGDLADPISDCVWFAGEATDRRYPATTHGALMSGQRTALAVASKLKNKT